MALFLIILLLGLGFIGYISYVRWRLSKALKGKLDLSTFQVYRNRMVSTSAKLKAGETLGIPIKCDVLINGRELHLIPVRFHPLLFMTDFPFTFVKAANKKMKPRRTERPEITFTGRKRKSSLYGSTFEVTIRGYDADEKREMLKKLKAWS